jgi:SAM-dependent methyltransferase
MLHHLASQPGQSCDLVFSAWAIGYSVPARIIAESHRVLRPGGTLAVIVNRLGTMPAVFAAFRKTMRAFPASLTKALWPRFPRSAAEIESHLKRHAFTVELLKEGVVQITPPEPSKRLDWLLGTGVLAGFDVVLPLRGPSEMQRYFANELDCTTSGWEHHYVMFIAHNQ